MSTRGGPKVQRAADTRTSTSSGSIRVAWLVKWSRMKVRNRSRKGWPGMKDISSWGPLVVERGQRLHALADGRLGAGKHLLGHGAALASAWFARGRRLSHGTELIVTYVDVGAVGFSSASHSSFLLRSRRGGISCSARSSAGTRASAANNGRAVSGSFQPGIPGCMVARRSTAQGYMGGTW